MLYVCIHLIIFNESEFTLYLCLFSVTLEIIHLMILIGDETEIHFYQIVGYVTSAAKVMIRTRI